MPTVMELCKMLGSKQGERKSARGVCYVIVGTVSEVLDGGYYRVAVDGGGSTCGTSDAILSEGDRVKAVCQGSSVVLYALDGIARYTDAQIAEALRSDVSSDVAQAAEAIKAKVQGAVDKAEGDLHDFKHEHGLDVNPFDAGVPHELNVAKLVRELMGVDADGNPAQAGESTTYVANLADIDGRAWMSMAEQQHSYYGFQNSVSEQFTSVDDSIGALDSRITQTASEIRSEVSKKWDTEAGQAWTNSQISQKANEIKSEVSETYTTKSETTSAISSVAQRADSIQSQVTQTAALANGTQTTVSSSMEQTTRGVDIRRSASDGSLSSNVARINENGLYILDGSSVTSGSSSGLTAAQALAFFQQSAIYLMRGNCQMSVYADGTLYIVNQASSGVTGTPKTVFQIRGGSAVTRNYSIGRENLPGYDSGTPEFGVIGAVKLWQADGDGWDSASKGVDISLATGVSGFAFLDVTFCDSGGRYYNERIANPTNRTFVLNRSVSGYDSSTGLHTFYTAATAYRVSGASLVYVANNTGQSWICEDGTHGADGGNQLGVLMVVGWR